MTINTTTTANSFEQTLADISGVEGWLTDAQAQRLWQTAKRVGDSGVIVEIGSYRGRSAIVLARASSESVSVIAIDPHAGNDRGPQQIHGTAQEGQGDNEVFWSNLKQAGVSERIRHIRLPSQSAHSEFDGEIDLLYIDGAHRFTPARADIADWGKKVRLGGTMLIHDSFSSIGVTLALIVLCFFNNRFYYVGRSGSMAEYRIERLYGFRRAVNGLRQVAELPYFARNFVIKIMLVLGLKKFARLLGHRDGPWPY